MDEQGKHQSCSHPRDDACERRITANNGYSAGSRCEVAGFPELVYPEIFVSKTENLKKKKIDNKKAGGGKKLGSPLLITKSNPLKNQTTTTT